MKIYALKPRDLIAIITIAGCFLLLVLGINHFVASVLLAIVGFYFGLHTKTPHDDDYGQSNSA